jgi:acetyl esterase
MADASRFAKLDPQCAEFMRQWERSSIPAMHELPPEDARQLVQALPKAPECVASVHEMQLPGPAGPITVRLYVPGVTDLSSQGRLPCIVFYHGGGWVVGSIDSHDALCRRLANVSGSAVASVDYRLAPEHVFPAAVEDSFAAIEQLMNRASELELDPARFAVCGDSAGGNLAAVMAIMMRDAGVPLAAQVLLYPITHHSYDTESYRRCRDGYFLSRATMEWFWNHYLPHADAGRDWRASPLLTEDLTGVAPAWVMTAEFDPLRDEGVAYARRLREAGVPVNELECAGMIHGFMRRVDQFDQAGKVVDWIAEAVQAACEKPLSLQ